MALHRKTCAFRVTLPDRFEYCVMLRLNGP
ncbi:hypothetical protein N183_24485 [Sinorhizobium sp. Sb3]|nr:hypothetical protein N183_24485 [Sinorhizobium sp. Sb3]